MGVHKLQTFVNARFIYESPQWIEIWVAKDKAIEKGG